MSFPQLPTEIIEIIISLLPQVEALNFSLTCKEYHSLSMKRLYENLLIYVPSFRSVHYNKSNYFLLSNWSIILLDAQELYDVNNFPIDMYYLISKKLELILSSHNNNLKYTKNLIIKGILRTDFIRDIFNELLSGSNVLSNLQQLTVDVPNTGSDYDHNNKHIQFQISSQLFSSFGYCLTNLQINIVELFLLSEPPQKESPIDANERILESFQNITTLQISILRQNLTYNDKNYKVLESFKNLKSLSLQDTSYNSGVMKFMNWLQYSTHFRENKMALETLELLLCHPYTTHLLPLKLDPEPFLKIIKLSTIKRFSVHLSCSNKTTTHICRCETEFMNNFQLENVEEFVINSLDYHKITYNTYIQNLHQLKKLLIYNIEYLDSYEKISTGLVNVLSNLSSEIEVIHIHSFFQTLNIRTKFIEFFETKMNRYNLYNLKGIIQNVILEYQKFMFESINNNIFNSGFDFWRFPMIEKIDKKIIKNVNIVSFHNYTDKDDFVKVTENHIREIIHLCIEYVKGLVIYLISKYSKLSRIDFGILQFDISVDSDGERFARCLHFNENLKIFANDNVPLFPNLI